MKTTRSPRRVFAAEEGTKGGRDVHSVAPQDPKDFLWLMTEEPHRTRRMAIMKAHPEVRYFVHSHLYPGDTDSSYLTMDR
jgi:sphingolipid delta-4 desaturase